ncbi:MAG: ATP-binding protein [bacterium]
MITRHIQKALQDALRDTPVVFVNGPRQAGKSTLVHTLIEKSYSATYVTFDDATMLSAARSDPAGFLQGFSGNLILDEVQRVPDLFLSIKAEVDRSRKPGRFILTGSANVLLLPKIAESLAGRMEILTLWPFSQGEIENRRERFIDRIFSEAPIHTTLGTVSKNQIIERVSIGGFPEALLRDSETRRNAWYGSYITTILQRDVRDISRLEGLTQLPKLLSLLATRVAQLLNIAALSNACAIPQTTLKRYLTLLETTYLIHLLPAWSGNLGKRLIKTPKAFLCDTGLLTYLLGSNTAQLQAQATMFGPVLENFIMMELLKQISWSKTDPSLYHFRTLRGQEVDLVLEDRKRNIVGIEVKASSTVTNADFKNIKVLQEISGNKFHRGVVLYTGSSIIPFGKSLFAFPVHSLWML